VICDSGAPGERDAPVDDQRLSMRAVVEASDRVPMNRVVPGDLAPAILERLQNLAADAGRADGIQQDLHGHSGLGAFGERPPEAETNLARPIDVRLDGD
jgi:hypothetical protein